MPERIEETLLVVAAFRDRGTDYVAGDRVPIRHRSIRRLAAKHPELFAMEYSTEPVDLEWLAELEVGYEEKYRVVKQARDGEKDRQQRALREELKSQDRSQPVLERLFAKQEAERHRREEEAREEREREELEREIAFTDDLRSGFNF
jgi:hypothetical protein